ncbi:MAG: zinc ribbon domain-containing protein, partial [Candidatus Poseidoniales archaeon]|nr:zinc ribbon domain-containing protein [Candidatus Poseidoniales archaeon]
MDCQVCSDEIPDDSLFCPECGARQDPSKSGAMGGRNFGVVSSQAVHATHDMQAEDAAGGTGVIADPSDFLNQIADKMADVPAQNTEQSESSSITDQVVDNIVESERAEKAGARNEWLAMNQKTASGVLAGLVGGEVPEHLASATGNARFLDDGQDIGLEKKRVKSNQPSPSLLRRMAEVAARRVARKRGVAVESPQVAMTDDDTVLVNVTYVDDGRVLDTPPDLSNAFEHAIGTELALKGFDIGIEIALFRSLDGNIELVWGEATGADEGSIDDDDVFACDDCGHYPVRDSDSSCPGCGAQFVDDDDDDDDGDWDDTPSPPSRGPGGPPSRGPSGGPGGPPRGPSRGPGGGSPSRGPGGGPPSRGPGGGP